MIKKTKKFVDFFKLYLKGQGVTTGYVGVALSDSPMGPFTYSHKFLGAGSPNGSGDYAMFQEENGDLYHLTVRKPDKAFVVGKMSDDYLLPKGEYVVCEGITEKTEAPAIVKRNGIYHLLGSGSSGWDPNAARYFTSKSLIGPWVSQSNPCEGVNPENGLGKEKTYGGQSTFILPVMGLKDACIAVFDINKPDNPITGRYIWLPIEWKDGKMSVSWRDSWDLSVFEDRPEDIIAASQAGASPLFFDPAGYAAPVIKTQNFFHPDEFKIREGLPNFFNKVKKGKNVVIGYLGGSITRSDNQYRLQSAKFIQNLFPQAKVTGINAGVSGTGSDLGACRLYVQLLQYHPDLIFIEFAVNGAFPDGVEGIIRQIWKSDPKIDICLIYTISAGQTKIYAEGKVPENIRRLENIADQYAIPSVHMGLQAGILEKEGKLIWKSDTTSSNNQIIFSADGTHPLEAGGNLYAEAIARAMLKMQNSTEDRVHQIGKPMNDDNWEDAKMLDPKSCATFSSDWNTIDPSNIEQLKQFAGWFPTVMKAEKPGSWIKFRFNGTMLGIFDIGGPEVGQIEMELDGKKMNFEGEGSVNFVAVDNNSAPEAINRFNKYCNNRYRGQCLFIKTSPGDHTVTLKISAEIPDKVKILGDKQLEDITSNPEKYNRSVIYLGKILLRGKILSIQ
ncbi:MAG: family 43 glycosylhydrolase [Mariniphaga sp.]